MLRPATPLAAVLLIAFALQLVATLSAPIIQSIPLAQNAGTTFGVFGSCSARTGCGSFEVGYDTSPDGTANDFSFSSVGTRSTLSAILVLHPVAALLSLISFVLAVAAHFHGPGRSSRFLLGLIIFMAPTFLVAILAFVIDLVLFLPHQAWGAYLTLVSAVLIFVSGFLTCCMRRMLVSRKEQKKRIAENAEMSGENFYNRQRAASPPPLAQQPTAPMVNGAPDADKLPGFAVYDSKSRVSDDNDRTPLDPSRAGTGMSSSSGRPRTSEDGSERYGRGGSSRGNRGRAGYNTPRDQYGNPLPPAAYMGGPSQDSQRSAGRGGYPPRGGPRGGPYRGRGGPPRGRGGPMMRGGPMRGGPMGGRGGTMGMTYGGPDYGPQNDQGYGDPEYGQPRGQEYDQGYGGPVPYGAGYGRNPSPGPPSAPGYGRQPSPRPPSDPGMRQPSPGAPGYAAPYGSGYGYGPGENLARAESPPPLPGDSHLPGVDPDPNTIGQAVEMDHLTGSPANTPGFVPPPHPFRDSDSDVQGMVGMQQNRTGEPLSPTSVYSSQRTDSNAYSRFAPSTRHGTPPLQALHGSPIPARSSPLIQQAPNPVASSARVSGDDYYEDVDPRFEQHPASLTPGPPRQPTEQSNSYAPPQRHPIGQTNSYLTANSETMSESSNFTSISERGVNPNWRPDDYGPGGVPNRGPPPAQQREFLLNTNPDFDIGRGQAASNTRGPGLI